ncbi:MAG: hypothetical protein H6706_20290 [Myxococcales bacterium]|nr:hypothetical protein [Myxococcales bacterium]
MRRRLLPWLAALLPACAGDDPPDPTPPTALVEGEARTVTLRFTPLDVTRFEKALGRVALRRLPADLLARTWLVDLPLTGGGLVDEALAALRARNPATLSGAEAALVRLLQMSPVTADLRGTTLEALLDLAPAVGLSGPEILAATLGVAPDEPFLSIEALGQALASGVIGSHPRAATRPGPDGAEVPVAPGHLPVFLDDVLSDLRTLPTRYGPAAGHPGFLGETRAALFGDDLEMTVLANVNGVPDQGIDLERAALAGVNSIDDHPEALFDFSDPDWLRISGSFRDPPVIERLTFTLFEDPRFFAGGATPDPAPYGDSAVWTAAPWTLERVIAEAAFAQWRAWDVEAAWPAADPLVAVSAAAGWLTLATTGEVGAPPPPGYIWDLLLDVAQIRLHDGGLAEGDAAVRLVLTDVPLGLTMDALISRVRASLEADASGLAALAARLFDNSWGEADVFYRRPRDRDEDWLFFIAPEDIPRDDAGAPVRPYSYALPGFFADSMFKTRVGGRSLVDGDAHHWKVQLTPGLELYVADEGDRRYRLRVGEKPGRSRISIEIKRIR